MIYGSKPTDGGNLLLTEEEANTIRQNDPIAAKYIRPFLGAEEFINNLPRYCLWLKDSTAQERKNSPEIQRRIEAVVRMRSASTDKETLKDAAKPYLFQKIRQTDQSYLLIPSVSSEQRKFIPIGYFPPSVIASNLVFMLPNATLYHFGILCSTMHNAWMRTVCGRMKSDYRYSNTIVYNNFPWPQIPPNPPFAKGGTVKDLLAKGGITEALNEAHNTFAKKEITGAPNEAHNTFAKEEITGAPNEAHPPLKKGGRGDLIEAAAQLVLAARAAEENRCAGQGQTCSLAALYASGNMPTGLLKAHNQLDKAVDAVYGYKPVLSKVQGGGKDDAARVAFLFERYRALLES